MMIALLPIFIYAFDIFDLLITKAAGDYPFIYFLWLIVPNVALGGGLVLLVIYYCRLRRYQSFTPLIVGIILLFFIFYMFDPVFWHFNAFMSANDYPPVYLAVYLSLAVYCKIKFKNHDDLTEEVRDIHMENKRWANVLIAILPIVFINLLGWIANLTETAVDGVNMVLLWYVIFNVLVGCYLIFMIFYLCKTFYTAEHIQVLGIGTFLLILSVVAVNVFLTRWIFETDCLHVFFIITYLALLVCIILKYRKQKKSTANDKGNSSNDYKAIS